MERDDAMAEKRKPLIIAEKPSAARAIAEALGGFRRKANYMESDEYLLSWAFGHLVDLWEPEDYNPEWRRWSLDSLPILPEEFRLKVIARTAAQFRVLERLVRRASSLINACDAGREGELIFRFIVQALGVDLPVQRLWVSSLTPEAIRAGFRDLRPGSEYDRLYQSALCRAQGDWLIGMNGTRAFSAAFGELLSVGRVQTPTLAMVVRREQEIRNFRPEPYWQVVAEFVTPEGHRYKGIWQGPEGDRLWEEAAAAAIRDRVAAAGAARVEAVETQEVAEKPPQLYDLTSLQREANRRFGLTAAATLKAAQTLYERKLITYPRTDSRYLTRDVARQVHRPLQALSRLPAYAALVEAADPARIWTGRVVNEARVTDHHAILPTGEPIPELTGVEQKIFDLIARRFLAQFFPEARFRDLEIWTRAGDEDRFRSRGRVLVDPGWQAADPPPRRRKSSGSARAEAEAGEAEEAGPELEGPLPDLTPDEPVTVAKVEALRKETQPPRRYTEASLLAAMEAAGQEIEDEELREAMKGRGLGTPATRAAIIERLKEVGYLQVRGKTLYPTPKAERLVSLVEAVGAKVLLSPELTGEWEKRIADIQAGTYDPDRLRQEMKALAIEVVEQVRYAALTGVGQQGTGPGAAAPTEAGGAAASGADGAAAAARAEVAAAAPAGEPAGSRWPEGLRAGTCPRCGSPVVWQGREWRCQGEGCTLRIPGELCRRPITPEEAGVILREGRSGLLEGFVSRHGRPFSAYLVLGPDGVSFEFPAAPAGRRGRTRKQRG
ncbi:MAG: DNA topoisomerase 3 [Firmicutes bacterium]|nr:DNA topoisomerase 3 [Bacillota bacterium]